MGCARPAPAVWGRGGVWIRRCAWRVLGRGFGLLGHAALDEVSHLSAEMGYVELLGVRAGCVWGELGLVSFEKEDCLGEALARLRAEKDSCGFFGAVLADPAAPHGFEGSPPAEGDNWAAGGLGLDWGEAVVLLPREE